MQQLKMALSDQNLELLPDYESRVEVLKRLSFIDQNATVLLKGRVACEVCLLDLARRDELKSRSTLRTSSF